ncbi:MAG: DNA-processing protein DprA [bacterium]
MNLLMMLQKLSGHSSDWGRTNIGEKILLNPESVARALLLNTRGVGPKLINSLIRQTLEISNLFETPDLLEKLNVEGLGTKKKRRLAEDLKQWDVDAARQKLKKLNIGVISRADDCYPEPLTRIYSPPPALFYRGNTELFSATSVAIVGTRKASSRGKHIARQLGENLASAGVCVVSGQAAGIDTAAHYGALKNSLTVAVLGTGLDRAYPAGNRDLQKKICERALVVSEYPPGSKPDARNFPRRNRIISGLSTAVVVVQAPTRSGALITADFALEQGRDVYAVPGRAREPLHSGCHLLIKQGAALVETAEDILDCLQLDGKFTPAEGKVAISGAAKQLLEELSDKPTHLDELVHKQELEIGECSRLLMELERENLALPLPGQFYQRSPDYHQLEIVEEASD